MLKSKFKVIDVSFGSKKYLYMYKDFTIYKYGDHFDIGTLLFEQNFLPIFHSGVHMKYCFDWPCGCGDV